MSSGKWQPFNQEIADHICETIASSNKSLATILKENPTFPKMTTIFKWLKSNADFANNYACAKESQADFLAEEIIDISDDSSNDLEYIDENGKRIENREFVNRSKLRVDARKWIAAKLKPKKYSDRLEIKTDDGVFSQEEREKRIAELQAKLNASSNNE